MFLLQFGKGIYFADICSKSANNCFWGTRAKNEGLVLLSEVAICKHIPLFVVVVVVVVVVVYYFLSHMYGSSLSKYSIHLQVCS